MWPVVIPHSRGCMLAHVHAHDAPVHACIRRALGCLSVEPAGGDPLLGLELEAGWWTKTTTAPGVGGDARYMCCRGAGRHVEYEYRSVAAVRASAECANAPLACPHVDAVEAQCATSAVIAP